MTSQLLTVVFLPGAGNHPPDLELFKSELVDSIVPLSYPNWQRFTSEQLSAAGLVRDLAAQVRTKAPDGPICIVGHSLGGHLGYAIGLQLQAEGRQIAGFCAIDSFMVSSVAPHKDWKQKAATRAWELLKSGRFSELALFFREKFWRLVIRLFVERRPQMLNRMSGAGKGAPADPVLENELSMRILLREMAPWIGSLDDHPRALEVPALLLRTGETMANDEVWKRRCPEIKIREVPGHHHSLFDAGNVRELQTAFHRSISSWATARVASFESHI